MEPTAHAELTLLLIDAVLAAMAFLLLAALVFGHLSDTVAKYVGIALWVDLGGLTTGILIFISSRVGSRVHMNASMTGVGLDLDSKS